MPDAPARETAQALAGSLGWLGERLPGGWSKRLDGATAVVSGIPAPTLNGVWCTEPEAFDSEERVAELLDALAAVAASGLPYCLQFPAGAQRLREVARRHGLVPDDELPLMRLDPRPLAGSVPEVPAPGGSAPEVSVPAGSVPGAAVAGAVVSGSVGSGWAVPGAAVAGAVASGVAVPGSAVSGLVVRRLDVSEAEEHARVAARGFGAPVEIFESLVAPQLASRYEVSYYVGELEGVAVVTGLALRIDGPVGVFNVATPPEHRRRGFGAALTARMVTDAFAADAPWVWLQSSPAGLGVYTALGFRTVASWECWIAT